MTKKVRIVLFIITLILLAAIALSFLIRPKANQITTLTLTDGLGPAINSSAPNFNLPQLTLKGVVETKGVAKTLSLPKGQEVMVTFFASWCTDCKQDLILLSSYQDRLRFSVIGIDSGDSKTAGENLIKQYGLKFPIGYDPGESLITGSYNTKGLPFSVLVNSKGIVVASHLGPLSAALLRQWQNKL